MQYLKSKRLKKIIYLPRSVVSSDEFEVMPPADCLPLLFREQEMSCASPTLGTFCCVPLNLNVCVRIMSQWNSLMVYLSFHIGEDGPGFYSFISFCKALVPSVSIF